MPLNPTGQDIQSYETGRAQARYNGQVPLAAPPPQGTPAWWSNTGTLDVWNGIPSRTGQEPVWRGNGGSELAPKIDANGSWIGGGTPPRRLDLGGTPNTNQPNPNQGQGPVIRKAPAYQPRTPNPQGQVFVPPPPLPAPPAGTGAVTKTIELYGVDGGKKVPLLSILRFDGSHYVLKSGARGRIAIGLARSDGFGYGGMPGSWATLYPSDSPSVFGLDPSIGIVAWDGRKVWAVPVNTLVEIWGPTWRDAVYKGV